MYRMGMRLQFCQSLETDVAKPNLPFKRSIQRSMIRTVNCSQRNGSAESGSLRNREEDNKTTNKMNTAPSTLQNNRSLYILLHQAGLVCALLLTSLTQTR
jgi:hypothetical protein